MWIEVRRQSQLAVGGLIQRNPGKSPAQNRKHLNSESDAASRI